MRTLFVALLTAALSAFVPVTAAGKALNYRALLIGVAQYPNLKKELELEGARNDVLRMREVLIGRGVPAQSITMLADSVAGAELPTRRRILDELERLAQTAQPDDYIIIHMAGHGSQQPVPAGSPHASDEPDGLFEIFLPRDVENWANRPGGQDGEVKNAIIDYEIRALVDRMTAAGAFVWGIFDSCHSATLVRSGTSSDVRLRQVTPKDLGVPSMAIDRAVARFRAAPAHAQPLAYAKASQTDKSKGGASVFFYAAQTVEPTPELRLPVGHPDRKWHGLFSFTIMQAIEGGGGMSYQQLGQQILTRYGAINEARATPFYDGTALSSPLLGQAANPVRQWQLLSGPTLAVSAGALADLNEGSIVAILPSAVAKTEEGLGYARVVKTEMASATLTPVAHADKPARTVAELTTGKIARLVQPTLRFEFAVSIDLAGCAIPCRFAGALEKVKASPVPGAQVKWVEASQTANLKLVAIKNQLWLMPPSMHGAVACTTGTVAEQKACQDQLERTVPYVEATASATSDGITTAIQTSLQSASRATNLLRIATSLGSSAAATPLKVSLAQVTAGGRRLPILNTNVTQVKPGDSIEVVLENRGAIPLDVTVLYLDSKFGVSPMFPSLGASNRLQAGAKTSTTLAINDSTLGLERLIVIAVEARRLGDPSDFSFLAQNTLASAIVSRGLTSEGEDARQMFRDGGFADFLTRGATPSPQPSNTGMLVFPWKVLR